MEERLCLYWCYKHGKKDNVMLLISCLDEMLSHDDMVITGAEEISLSRSTLKYVYCVSASVDRITTLLTDQDHYYVLDNVRGSDGAVTSRVWVDVSIISLLSKIPSPVRKVMGLKPFEQQRHNAKSPATHPIDFARADLPASVELWKSFVKSREGDVLDLSGFYFLTSRVIVEAGIKVDTIKTVVLSQNIELDSINWLFYFPCVNTVTIWNCDIEDGALAGIQKYGRGIQTLEFHNCANISGRVIPHVLEMPLLENLIIDNTSAIFHPEGSLHRTSLTDEEWAKVTINTSIRQVLINSANLTRDFIKPLLGVLSGLEHFIMHEVVMRQLEKNSSGGDGTRKIVFHSQDDLKVGFSRTVKVNVYGLVRDKCGPMFSSSMLAKIKTLDPTKAEIADEMMKQK
jgi:hypothetical protein